MRRSWTSRLRLLVIPAVALGMFAAANMPTTSSVMIDFVPRTVAQPLYAKVIAFLDRDIQMRQLSAAVVGDAGDPEQKADRILVWTAANVHPTPRGMPVVDDHPYSIVIRGYGEPDQAADVFANLAGYAGLPGGLVFSRAPDGSVLYAFAVLEINGADRVFDVRESRALRDRTGALASLDSLRADPSLLDALPAPSAARGVRYPALIQGLEAAPHRSPLDQMPLERLMNEIRRLLHR